MKRFSALLLAILLGLVVIGCSTDPVYYSEEEVKSYVSSVFGEGYTLSDTLTHKDSTEEQNDRYEYIFTKENEATFSVFTSTSHFGIDATTTAYYVKRIYDNFIDKNVEFKYDDIVAICDTYAIDCDTSGDSFEFYLEDYSQFHDLAKLITELDTLLDLEYNYKNWNENMNSAGYGVFIYLEPNNENYDKKSDDWRIRIFIPFSTNKKDRLTKESAFGQIESYFVSSSRSLEEEYEKPFIFPDEVLDKYPVQN